MVSIPVIDILIFFMILLRNKNDIIRIYLAMKATTAFIYDNII